MNEKWRERKEKEDFEIASSLQGLLNLDSKQFEDIVALMFRRMGYDASQTAYTGDGGKDVIMRKDGKLIFVECKRYVSTPVGRPDIQKFHSAIITEKAHFGYFVTTSSFTSEAEDYVSKNKLNIELLSGHKLVTLMREAFE
jgi:restriction endonuclease Mrr